MRLHPTPRSGPIELASGIDALYMSGRGSVDPTLWDELEAKRRKASEQGGPAEVGIGGQPFRVSGGGLGRYRIRLQHEHGLLALTDSVRIPTVRVQPRAEFLHAQGPRAALSWFGDVAAELAGVRRLTASRVDLFADWQRWDLSSESRHRFVTRARQVTTREEARDFTGFEFGRRATGTVSARVYDKLRDLRVKGTDWWFDVWGNGSIETGRSGGSSSSSAALD